MTTYLKKERNLIQLSLKFEISTTYENSRGHPYFFSQKQMFTLRQNSRNGGGLELIVSQHMIVREARI